MLVNNRNVPMEALGSNVLYKSNGRTRIYDTGYTIVQFTTVGTQQWVCPSGVTAVEFLVVGGGGRGGNFRGGGGGAGQVRSGYITTTPGQSYTVTVGAGSASSVFGPITSVAGRNGGSGDWNAYGGTSGNEYAGGSQLRYATGGGGGAGGVGQNAPGDNYSDRGGNGGTGVVSSILGTPVYYGGGGAGSTNENYISYGGDGGGGNCSYGYPRAGAANKGGGGSGGGGYNTTGGSGGSGIVVIKFRRQIL